MRVDDLHKAGLMTNSKYPICDGLMANGIKHCASVVIVENMVQDETGWPCIAQPSDQLRNGTITFIARSGRVFGITCWHVLNHFYEQIHRSGDPFSHSMRTMVNGFYFLPNKFIQPQSPIGNTAIDIAICELDPDLLRAIGKIPFDLERCVDVPKDIRHAYALGFPEKMKRKKMIDEMSYQVSMPHLEVLAETVGVPNCRFALFSEIDHEVSEVEWSGMSGGPIFWSTEDHYGIFGIVYEAGSGSKLSHGKAIHLFGELATPDAIDDWISQIL